MLYCFTLRRPLGPYYLVSWLASMQKGGGKAMNADEQKFVSFILAFFLAVSLTLNDVLAVSWNVNFTMVRMWLP
jgi:hypothetical protein